MDSLRGARQPARHRGLSRRAFSRGRYAHRPNRLRDLLRLAVSRGAAAVGGEWGRGADPGLRLHGSMGRDRAHELVEYRQPLPRPREHCLRRCRQPGREPAALSAVLVARREPDRRLRRPHAGRSVPRTRRAHRRRPDRHQRAASRTRDEARTSDAGASPHGSVPGVCDAAVPASPANGGSCRAAFLRTQQRADRCGEAADETRRKPERQPQPSG